MAQRLRFGPFNRVYNSGSTASYSTQYGGHSTHSSQALDETTRSLESPIMASLPSKMLLLLATAMLAICVAGELAAAGECEKQAVNLSTTRDTWCGQPRLRDHSCCSQVFQRRSLTPTSPMHASIWFPAYFGVHRGHKNTDYTRALSVQVTAKLRASSCKTVIASFALVVVVVMTVSGRCVP
jgi:hypothetical protein